MNWYLNYLLRRHWGGEKDLSWIWWVKCILRYIPPSEGVERTTKTQRTQRLIDHIAFTFETWKPISENSYSVYYYFYIYD